MIFRKSISGATELSLARFVARARRAVGMRGRVTVLVTSSRELRDLNRRFRGKDKATDVLSFPAASIEGDDNEGDIAISADIASENATRFGHEPSVELKILTLHGILHLAGYDHETDNGQMARKEARLRRELRLPDALIERTERPDARDSKARNGDTRGGIETPLRNAEIRVRSEGHGFSRAVKSARKKGASAPEGSAPRPAKPETRNAKRKSGNGKRGTGNGVHS